MQLPHSTMDGSIADLMAYIDKKYPDGGKADRYSALIPVTRGEGTGHWTLYKLSPHLLILIANIEYHSDKRILVPSDTMAKVRVLLAGGLRSSNGTVELDGTGAFVESYPGSNGSSYVVRGGDRTRLVILNCDRAFFEEELGLPEGYLPYPISYLFDRQAEDPKGSVVALGPDVLRAANEIMRAETRFEQPVIFPYLAAKAKELACAMIAELNAARERPVTNLRSSVRDVSRINEARDIILDQFQRPPTIPQLARSVGVNQTKLKALFKNTFGLTIHEFTQKCRMDRAAELLTTTDVGIAEIAYAVGYDHAASFTHAFKGHFGHAPSQVRRANMKADGSPRAPEASSVSTA
ncbi:AraC family transcriptional regulator [Novosphingobium sp. Gsoil 351]|uniref:helix-turn-helix domain-containing protein n=1 Tax=Novosphingobium sp. Gsoil 351 TaxID=2675225 RepID=UPI0018A80C24|nr:AraC family transcriptional regulator [Novosphingobium sp. Gsoil 351]